MKFTFWCLGPFLLLVVLSRLFEVDARGHAHPGFLMMLGTAWGMIGGMILVGYFFFCVARRSWQGPKAMRDIAEEMRLARLAREQGDSGAASSPSSDSGRIFGRLS